MQFDECYEGEYRIHVGALDAPRGEGFIAAVVVSRLLEAHNPPSSALGAKPGAMPRGRQARRQLQALQQRRAREVWRDDSLACGYRWPTAEAAMHYAKNRAREMVRKGSPMLA